MTDQNTTQTQATGLPLRGMAMILIACAILLAGWGVYSATRSDEDPTINTGATQYPTQPAPPQGASPEQQPATNPDNQAAAPAEQNPEAAPAPAEVPAPANAPAPAQAPGTAPRTVHVLNNSTVQGLAKDVGDQLTTKGYQLGEVGNLADTIVPENTVYYSPSNPAAEQAARELADSVGGIAVARTADLPAETNDPGTLVLVLVGQTNVN